MKNYLVYYQHYANSHRHWKFKMLRSKYGWSGEGRFWALNNLIASSSNSIINLSKKAIEVSVADELNLSIEELRLFIKFLYDDCELLIYVDNKITVEILRENLKEVMKVREKARNNKNKSLEKSLDEKPKSFPKILNSFP